MTTAQSVSTPAPTAGLRPADAAAVHHCTILNRRGEFVSEGLAVRIARDQGDEIRVTQLSQPGALLNLHVGKGVRDFQLALDDQAPFRVELLTTTWEHTGQRMCRFITTSERAVA